MPQSRVTCSRRNTIFGNDPVTDNAIGEAMGLPADNPNAGPTEARYTDPGKLAQIHEVKQVNLIGDALRLEVDNPAAGLGDIKFTDPEKRKQIDQMREWIRDVGGDDAMLTVTPAVYASPTDGVMTTYLLRVEGDKNNDGEITREETVRHTAGSGRAGKHLDDEDVIIDPSVVANAANGANVTWKYDDFEKFQKDNALDDKGRLYMVSTDDMLLHTDASGHVNNINFDGVDAAITTTWEKIQPWADRAAAVVGLIGGGLLIAGTGGLAAPLLAGAAMAYGAYRTGEQAGLHARSRPVFQSDQCRRRGGLVRPVRSYRDEPLGWRRRNRDRSCRDAAGRIDGFSGQCRPGCNACRRGGTGEHWPDQHRAQSRRRRQPVR